MTEKSIKPHESNVRTIMKTLEFETVWKCIFEIPKYNTVFILLMKSGPFSNGADPPPLQVKSPCCWTAPGQPPSSLGVPSNAWSWTGSALNACWDCAQRSWRGTSRDTTASSLSPCDTFANSGRHQQRAGVISIPDLGGRTCGIRVKDISFTSCRIFLHFPPFCSANLFSSLMVCPLKCAVM